MRFFFFCALLLILPITAHASDTVEDSQIWATTNITKTFSDQWSANMETQVRFTEDSSTYGNRFLRPSLSYKITPNLTLTGGYAHVLTNASRGRESFSENRPWQQVGYQFIKNDAGFALSSRTRLEQRFVEDSDDTGWRLRQQMRFEAPIKDFNDQKLKAVLWDEFFTDLNETDWGQDRDTYQNRSFIGISIPINKAVSFETGYMNQAIFRQTNNQYNHVSASTLNVRF
jgi:hypothetical protein